MSKVCPFFLFNAACDFISEVPNNTKLIQRKIWYSHSYKNIFHKYVLFPKIQHAFHNKIEIKLLPNLT